MLTEGFFTRDEWSHLLRLFNNMNFSMFSCSHLLSCKNTEHHVEESSGKKVRRRACGGEIEASEFDIKKFELESIAHVGFGYLIQPGELQIGLEFWSHTHWEIRARQKRKLSVKFSSVEQIWQSFSEYREIGARDESAFKDRETGAWWTESTYRGEVEPPQSRDLQYSIHWESLHECSTKVESSRRRPDSAGPKSQCIVMEIIHVNNNESSDTSWRKLQWQFVHLQEHQLRGAQDVVRLHAETDLEPEARLHDWMAICYLSEINLASWRSNQVVKSKGTRPFQIQFFVWTRCTDIQIPW